MLRSLLSRLSVVFCIFLTLSHISSAMNIRPQRNDVSNVADALKYLQELDSIYSQISRPRIVARSGEKLSQDELQNAIKLLQLDIIDRLHSVNSRPRFGKRSGFPRYIKDDNREEPDEEWETKLFARR